jgi:hypothetical protein
MNARVSIETEARRRRQRHGRHAHVEELLKLAPDFYDITVFGREPHPNYNRILLSPVLAGEQTLDDIVLNPRSGTPKTVSSTCRHQRSRGSIACVASPDCRWREGAYDRLLLPRGRVR